MVEAGGVIKDVLEVSEHIEGWPSTKKRVMRVHVCTRGYCGLRKFADARKSATDSEHHLCQFWVVVNGCCASFSRVDARSRDTVVGVCIVLQSERGRLLSVPVHVLCVRKE